MTIEFNSRTILPSFKKKIGDIGASLKSEVLELKEDIKDSFGLEGDKSAEAEEGASKQEQEKPKKSFSLNPASFLVKKLSATGSLLKNGIQETLGQSKKEPLTDDEKEMAQNEHELRQFEAENMTSQLGTWFTKFGLEHFGAILTMYAGKLGPMELLFLAPPAAFLFFNKQIREGVGKTGLPKLLTNYFTSIHGQRALKTPFVGDLLRRIARDPVLGVFGQG